MKGKEKTKEELLQELSSMRGRIAELEVSESKLSRMEEMLHLVAKGTSALTGEDFMRSLVRHLALALKTRFAFIGELVRATGHEIQVHAVWTGEDFSENFRYELEGTPCDNVVGKTACFYPDGVQKLFPDDHMLVEMGIESYLGVPLFDPAGCPIGILVAMDTKPMENLPAAESALTVFASRAGAELNRRRAEEALRLEKERLYGILDLFPGFVCLQAPDHSIRFANRRFIEEYGDPGDRPCHEVIWDRNESCEECPTFRVFDTKRPEMWVAEDTSRDRVYQVYDEPFIDSDGSLLVLEFSIDITEQRRTETELLKAQKLESLGVLAGGIAHDFNNLLTGVIGNLSLLEHMIDGNGKAYKRLMEVEKAAIQAKELTQQLLTFSMGGQPVKKTMPIGILIQECAVFALRGTNVRCDSSIPKDLWLADVDEGQISQAINNIAINAVQAMPEGGILKISAENLTLRKKDKLPLKEGRYVRISIEDQGTGIPDKLMPKIFDPYFTTKQKGSGLGLASSYSIVKKHGGHIEVSSKVGAGTTFGIYLPASQEGAVVETKEETEVSIPAGGRVLVMDDEEIIRDVATEMLTIIGYEVKTAIEGGEAVRLYEEAKGRGEPFDAVILDLTIPGGMGGKEAVKKLLQVDPEVRVIVSSGYSNDPVMANFKEYGFSGVIIKPYKASELGAKVRQVIARKD